MLVGFAAAFFGGFREMRRGEGSAFRHTYYGDIPVLEEDGVVGLDQCQGGKWNENDHQHESRKAYRHDVIVAKEQWVPLEPV